MRLANVEEEMEREDADADMEINTCPLFHRICSIGNGVYDTVISYIVYVYSYIAYLIPFLIVYTLHICSTHLYASLCANFSIIGFMNSLFLFDSPICSMILQIVTSTNTAFIAIISSIYIYVIAKILRT
jgi:hypothetical protein